MSIFVIIFLDGTSLKKKDEITQAFRILTVLIPSLWSTLLDTPDALVINKMKGPVTIRITFYPSVTQVR